MRGVAAKVVGDDVRARGLREGDELAVGAVREGDDGRIGTGRNREIARPDGAVGRYRIVGCGGLRAPDAACRCLCNADQIAKSIVGIRRS